MIRIVDLPDVIRAHLPKGLKDERGFSWLVLPETRIDNYDGITEMNQWIRQEDWYPEALADVIWFGDARDGNILGWHPKASKALLWNPEDGATPWKEGTVEELWQFIRNDYQ